MRRREFLALLAATLGGACAGRDSRDETTAAATRPGPGAARGGGGGAGASAAGPNIVLFVADDLGYADLGCYGGQDVPTPNIDSIARGGVRFTSGYVTCPVCSPTRAGLMTGRYQQRFGHEFNPGPGAEEHFGLPLEEITLPQLLRQGGYATGMVGKWHLGTSEPYRPTRRGFDEFFGFLGGAHAYTDLRRRDMAPIYRGSEPVEVDEYLTDAFGREAVDFVRRHRDRPFFLYVPFNAIHTPMQATAKYLERFEHIADERRRTMAAMLSAMDDAIGGVLRALHENGLERDTLIFFLSDNGGPTQGNGSRNDPFSGFKAQLREGGIRVPYLVQWKNRLPANRVIDAPVSSLDIFTTALSAAGAGPPRSVRIDGADLLPLILGKSAAPPHEALYWRFGETWAVRRGPHKLLRLPDRQEPMLFDLSADPAEQNDLASQHPQRARELRELYAVWDAQMQPPRWERRPVRPGPRRRPRRNRAEDAAPGR